MGNRRGIRPDLDARLREAEALGSCLVASSESDSRRLRAAVARGVLVSPAQGVYAHAGRWSELRQSQRALMTMRALQQLHPSLVFCGPSAALAHGLAVSFSLLTTIHVATSRRTHARSHGMRGVERHIVENDVPVHVSGVCVTSLQRTVFDCLRSAGFREGLAIADSALRKSASSLALAEDFSRMDYHLLGHERAIDTLRLADGRAESGGESIARAVMIERGFRLPELQYEIPDLMNRAGGYRADFYWHLEDGTEVAGELDGHEKYVNPQMTGGRDIVEVLANERQRESRISGSGAKIMRFSYRQILDRTYFTRLLCSYGIPRDAEVPWVAVRDDDPEALLARHERLFLGRWMVARQRLPMPQVA